MTHEKAQLASSRRLDEPLEPAETADLESHLKACAECARFSLDLETALGALAPVAAGPFPVALHARVMAQVRATPQTQTASVPWGLLWSACAAAVLVLAAIPFFVFKAPPAPHRPAPVMAPPQPQPDRGEPFPSHREKAPKPHDRFHDAAGRINSTERILGRMAPLMPPPHLIMRGRGGPEPTPTARPYLATEMDKAGLGDLASDPRVLAVLERRLERKQRLKELKQAGSIGEGKEGMLASPPWAKEPSDEDRAIIEAEHRDRSDLFGLYSQVLVADSTASPEQREKMSREQFAEAMRGLVEPGEWYQDASGGWGRKQWR